jgi:hypothetical protein
MAPLAASGAPRGSLDWDAGNDAYVFDLETVQYRAFLGAADERTGLLRVEARLPDGEWLPLIREAGMLYREAEGAVLPPRAAHERCELQEVRHTTRGRSLSLKYAETAGERTLERTVTLRPAGAALELEVSAPGKTTPEGFCGFSLGQVGPDEARTVLVPGLPDPLLVAGGGFLSGYVDRYRGQASSYPPRGAFYRPDTEGAVRAISDFFYLTLSPEPVGPLPALRRPAAPFRIALENRVVVDLFSDLPYADDERLLRLLPLYGLEDVLLIYRNWQQFGYRRRGPALYPANPDRGSNQDFRRLVSAASDAGWLVALREEYAAVSPDSPYWSEKAVAEWPDGQPRASRWGGHAVRADRMLDYARLEATKIQRNYRPSATFVDGHTAWNPESALRQAGSSPGAGCDSEAEAIRHVGALLAFLREIHEGPIVGSAGEGPARLDTFTEGLAEGVIRGPDGGAGSPLIVDYELREVRPRLLGVGAGSYRQYCGNPQGEAVDAARIDWDAYRATEIALGHLGYVGNYGVRPGPRGIPFPGGSAASAAREYFLLRALQELHVGSPVRSILYRLGDEMLELAEALRRGADMVNAQVRVEYASGLVLWVNRSASERWTAGPEDAPFELPPSGFAAVSPRHRFLAYSALVSGNRTDFCRSSRYTFLDVRSSNPRTVEGITADGSVALLPSLVPQRHDVVLVNARLLKLGEAEYHLSDRGDLRLTHLSPHEVEVTVMDTEAGKPAHVNWPAFGPPWKGSTFQVLEQDAGAWRPSRCQVQQTRSGPQLNRAQPGVTYRIRPR